MTRNLVFVVLFGLLPACATPLQQCVADASGEYQAVSAKIIETRANIERGYALHSQTVPYRANDCYRHRRWDNDDPFDYWDVFFDCSPRQTTITIPVAVDLKDQQRRLEALEAQRQKLAGPAREGVAQCKERFAA